MLRLFAQRLEVGVIAVRPPVAHGAGGVVLGAAIVKHMGNLVGDGAADGPQVGLKGGILIIERSLEDARGENEGVGVPAGCGVDGEGRHRETPGIHRLVQALNGFLPLVRLRGGHIGKVAAAVGNALDVGIVKIPLVGVADQDRDVVQLLHGLLLSGFLHPVQPADAGLKGFNHHPHHLLHLGLGLGGEVALHVKLAQFLREEGLHGLVGGLLGGACFITELLRQLLAQVPAEAGNQGALLHRLE